SIVIANRLAALDANIKAYDPIAVSHAKRLLPEAVTYTKTIEEAVKDADAVMILTDWEEIKQFSLSAYKDVMKEPIIFDGRNCHELDEAVKAGVEYVSVGRKTVVPGTK
ncbi:UDP-glucose/GDP-mannose dehydrogenase family protein, partial [Staphylococcus aureus]